MTQNQYDRNPRDTDCARRDTRGSCHRPLKGVEARIACLKVLRHESLSGVAHQGVHLANQTVVHFQLLVRVDRMNLSADSFWACNTQQRWRLCGLKRGSDGLFARHLFVGKGVLKGVNLLPESGQLYLHVRHRGCCCRRGCRVGLSFDSKLFLQL